MPDSDPLPSAKLMPKVEELRVTTGPFPASRKVRVPGRLNPQISIAMREIELDSSAGEPPVRAYDTSGPYSDPAMETDINRGLPELRKPWIVARGDVEYYEGPGHICEEEVGFCRSVPVPTPARPGSGSKGYRAPIFARASGVSAPCRGTPWKQQLSAKCPPAVKVAV